jgi:hypothetical protein
VEHSDVFGSNETERELAIKNIQGDGQEVHRYMPIVKNLIKMVWRRKKDNE